MSPGVSGAQHKSGVIGASSNLINAIVGAGIVGIPFAVQQAGLVTGIVLVILCAVLAEKSLRLLIETARHVHVNSYETLVEVAFGKFGFYLVLGNMLFLAYGSMVTYLMIVKDTLPLVLFGVDASDLVSKRWVLLVVSLFIIVPLSSQRDMADLAKTSRINVVFDTLMVLVVMYKAKSRLVLLLEQNTATGEEEQGSLLGLLWTTLTSSTILHVDTVFVGLGVLSFAFVCQHSAFIIAGSLQQPSHQWGTVTKMALTMAGTLATLCGASAYMGFHNETIQGNILNNLGTDAASELARFLLGSSMLFVYPLESFVARHACVVLFFQRKQQPHGEDDIAILSKHGLRIALTVLLYVMALVPAMLFQDLGEVLAATGTVGGSCLSYIIPGAIYLGVHGERFLDIVALYWGKSWCPADNDVPGPKDEFHANEDDRQQEIRRSHAATSMVVTFVKASFWYGLLMPIWCAIAVIGGDHVRRHFRQLELNHTKNIAMVDLTNRKTTNTNDDNVDDGMDPLLTGVDSSLPSLMGTGIVKSAKLKTDVEDADDPQRNPPRVQDFCIAIGYILFGTVALFAGLLSIFMEEKHK